VRLGPKQLQLLTSLGSPAMLLVVPDAISRSLEKRGLVADYHGMHRITPAGLRALADAFEAGRLEAFMRPLGPPKAA
jgi:hypothetical protein